MSRPHNVAAGSTADERRITLAVAVAGIVLAWTCASIAGVNWAIWQWAVVLFVAFDLIGGVMAMCLPPAIHKLRPPDFPWRPIQFAALHIHPFVLALAIPSLSAAVLFALYIATQIGVLCAALAPKEFRAGLVLAWCVGGISIAGFLGDLPGLDWFAAAYLLKLVGSHAVADVTRL